MTQTNEEVADVHAYTRLDEEQKSEHTSTTQSVPLPNQNAEVAADDFDRQFFQNNKKLKLTKDQRRALKFAAKQGLDIDQIEDI